MEVFVSNHLNHMKYWQQYLKIQINMVEFLYFLSFTPLTLAKVDPFSVCPPQPIIDWLYFGKTSEEKVGKNENANIGGGVQTIF